MTRFLVLLAVFGQIAQSLASCPGCVELDEITFPKLVGKFRYSLVKFDIAFPYGEKHEAFSDFAKTVSASADDLLVGLVGVKDYGDKDNSKLAERYGIQESSFPVVMLFKGDVLNADKAVQYPLDSPLTFDGLKQFVRENSGLYIGLEGCLKEMDLLVAGFLAKTKEEKEECLEKAAQLRDAYSDSKVKAKAKVYTAIIARLIEKGEAFLHTERLRLDNLLKGKISDNKKLEIVHRMNILQSFEVTGAGRGKDEL